MDVTTLPIPEPVFWRAVTFALLAVAVVAVFGAISFLARGAEPSTAQKHLGLEALPQAVFFLASVLWVLLTVVLFVGLLGLILDVIWHPMEARLPSPFTRFWSGLTGKTATETWDFRFRLAQTAALTTVLGAVIALPVTLNRLALARRNTLATEESSRIAEMSRFDDRLQHALTSLAARRTQSRIARNVFTNSKTEPPSEREESYLQWQGDPLPVSHDWNYRAEGWKVIQTEEDDPDRRVSAIDELYSLARERPSEVTRIGSLINAYLKSNAPADTAADSDRHDWKRLEQEAPMMNAHEIAAHLQINPEYIEISELRRWASHLQLRPDLLLALATLGRDTWHSARTILSDASVSLHTGEKLPSFRADLRRCNLQGAELSECSYAGGRFDGSRLDGLRATASTFTRASFNSCDLSAAQFSDCRFFGANFYNACLDGAIFTGGALNSAGLISSYGTRVHFISIDLLETNVKDVDYHNARFLNCSLAWRDLSNAKIRHARFEKCIIEWHIQADAGSGVDLEGSSFRNCDLTKSSIASSLLENTFGDASVELPDGVPRPSHWEDENLNAAEFKHQWHIWRHGYPPLTI